MEVCRTLIDWLIPLYLRSLSIVGLVSVPLRSKHDFICTHISCIWTGWLLNASNSMLRTRLVSKSFVCSARSDDIIGQVSNVSWDDPGIYTQPVKCATKHLHLHTNSHTHVHSYLQALCTSYTHTHTYIPFFDFEALWDPGQKNAILETPACEGSEQHCQHSTIKLYFNSCNFNNIEPPSKSALSLWWPITKAAPFVRS